MTDKSIEYLQEIDRRVRRMTKRVGAKATNAVLCRLLERKEPICSRELILTCMPATSKNYPIPDFAVKNRMVNLMKGQSYTGDALIFTKCVGMMAETAGTDAAFDYFIRNEALILRRERFVRNMYIVLASAFKESGDTESAEEMIKRLLAYPPKVDTDCPPQINLPIWLSKNGFDAELVREAKDYVTKWREVASRGLT